MLKGWESDGIYRKVRENPRENRNISFTTALRTRTGKSTSDMP